MFRIQMTPAPNEDPATTALLDRYAVEIAASEELLTQQPRSLLDRLVDGLEPWARVIGLGLTYLIAEFVLT